MAGKRSSPRLSLYAAGVIMLVALLAFPAFALAHAAVARAEPAPGSVLQQAPERVIIRFTEPVEPRFSKITVLDSQGRQVDKGDSERYQNDPAAISVTLQPLPDGIYTVAWTNLSAVDGHGLSGSYVFSVGVPLPVAPQPVTPRGEGPAFLQSPAEPVLHWLGLLSILTIIGTLVFELFIARAVFAAATESASPQMESQINLRTFKLAWLAVGVFAMASIGDLIVKTSLANNIPLLQALGRPALSFLETGWGGLWLWRMNILLAMFAVLLLAWLDRHKRRESGGREWQIVALVLAAGVLFTISLVSHGAAVTEIRAAAIFSDYLHLLAASVWVGGLFYLALVVPPIMKAQRQRQKVVGGRRDVAFCPESHVAAMSRFSALATLSVGTLLITGLYSAWAQVTTVEAIDTTYGKVLLAKLGLIVPLLALGAVNSFWVKPRLATNGKALTWLRRVVTIEAILAILVLLSVGILISLEPARQAVSRQEIVQTGQLVLQTTAEDINVKVIIEPGNIGTNLAAVFLTDRTGRPVVNASAMALQLTYLDRDLEPATYFPIDHGSGIWVEHEAVMSVAGNWQARLTIQRPDAFDATATLRFPFPPGAGAIIVPSAKTGKLLWIAEMVLLGILALGVSLHTIRVRRGRS
ncbi:MAG: CopD family protein [Chloroflexi bacterium]|nr:CopD family protein [Chloroflexota bacterium]